MSQSRHTFFSAWTLLALAIAALAWVSSTTAATIDWVSVGDAGNAADPTTGGLYGAVAYNYQISKYQVTVGQYAEFLNAVAADDTYGLYSTNMASNANIAGISRSGSPGSYSYSVI